MTTFCNTDPNTPVEIREKLNAIEESLRGYVTTPSNPCGGAAYYDEGEAKPWRLLYCDGCDEESFVTADEAIKAASDYADEMDDE